MSTVKKPSLTRLLGIKNAADLNMLLTNELCLSETVLQSLNTALQSFVEFLKTKLNGGQGKKFKEILIGGSLGMNTEVNNEDDVDASLYIMLDYGSDDLANSVSKFKENLSGFMQSLKATITSYGDSIEIDDVSVTSVTCTLSVVDCPLDVEVEILPSLSWDLEDDAKRAIFYEQMIDNIADRRYYATSLCRLQINYIKDLKNARVRNLIRLTKFWRHRAFSDEDENVTLPSAHLLQLLVVSLWGKAGKPETFKPSHGFKAVMEEVKNYTQMYIVSNVYYSKDKAQRALLNPRHPILVDPCDPTRNLAAECNCWNDVATVASATLGKPMIQEINPSPRWQ